MILYQGRIKINPEEKKQVEIGSGWDEKNKLEQPCIFKISYRQPAQFQEFETKNDKREVIKSANGNYSPSFFLQNNFRFHTQKIKVYDYVNAEYSPIVKPIKFFNSEQGYDAKWRRKVVAGVKVDDQIKVLGLLEKVNGELVMKPRLLFSAHSFDDISSELKQFIKIDESWKNYWRMAFGIGAIAFSIAGLSESRVFKKLWSSRN